VLVGPAAAPFGHGNGKLLRPRNRRLWWGTVLDWIDQYLKPAPPPAGAR